MRTIIDLSDRQIDALERISRSRKLSRAELIRQAVDRYLKEHLPERDQAFGLWKREGIQAGGGRLPAPAAQGVEPLRALFDTNILIDYLNGIAAVKSEIAHYQRPAISVISWIEALAGTKPDVEAGTRNFLQTFERIDVTEKVADQAVTLRRAVKMRIPDAIILATARVENLILVTRNTKDFRADEPGIRVPYRI